jgi:hypothetical protein
VSTIIAAVFDTPQLLVNMCVLIFLISFIPANFIVIKVLDVYGMRTALMLASLLTFSGAWLR